MTNRLARLARLALAVLGLFAARLEAQRPAARARSGVGYIRGVVYDSLLRAPLDSARVYVDGTGISDITDEGGRFRLDSVPAGRAVIVVEHPDLDSAGVPTLARRVDVPGGRVTVVDLAVPSLFSMHRAACPGAIPPAGRDSGLVFGTVTDAASGARLVRARVHVGWVRARLGVGGIEVSRPGEDAVTDSVGNYYVCGVPTEYMVTVSAAAGAFTSGVTELLLGQRRMARRDIAVARDSAALPDSTGMRRGSAVVIGSVMDEHDQPRPSARASLDDAAGDVYADENGRFVLSGLPSGSHMLMVRMIGYSAARLPVRLRAHDTTRVMVRIRQLTVLDTLRVTAASGQNQFELADLQERMRMGLGYFLTGEDVKHRQSMRAVFQGLPGMTIEGRSTFQFVVETMVNGRMCPATLYVDGFPSDYTAIQSYRPDQLVAVEWYPRGSQAPIKYQPVNNAECSVLLVWTRFIR